MYRFYNVYVTSLDIPVSRYDDTVIDVLVR